MEILVYDGQCNMCSHFIRFIIKTNRNPNIKITDFDSRWYKDNIKDIKTIDSMIFIKNNRMYIYSDAVLNLLISNNKGFIPLFIFKLFPRFIRDNIYKYIAKRRKRLMANSSCAIPTKNEKEFFIP